MKRLILAFAILTTLAVFDANAELESIYISCDSAAFAKINKRPKEDIYIPVAVEFKGQTWKDAEMRVRGDDSRSFPKKSYRIKFNSKPFANGRKKINLNAEYLDESYVCQYLSSIAYAKAGVPCFKSEHVRMYINGRFYGLYLMIEVVDEDFLKSRGLDPKGELFKASLERSTLSVFDTVRKNWEKKTSLIYGYDVLEDLRDRLNMVPDWDFYNFIKRYFDYDNFISFLAMGALTANGSAYYHNYYLYYDRFKTKKWTLIPWDLDKTFFKYGYLLAYNSFGKARATNPIFGRAWANDKILSDVRAKIDEFASDFFNSEFFDPIIDSLKEVLEASVAEDERDLVDSLGTWLSALEKNKKYVRERRSRLVYQFENFPRTFEAERTTGIYRDSVEFKWRSSKSPAGKPITYELAVAKDYRISQNVVFEKTGIKDTVFVWKPNLPDGIYYWRIEASDGKEKTEAFNRINRLELCRGGEVLSSSYDGDLTLDSNGSPYFVLQDLVVNGKLTLKPGTRLVIADGASVRASEISAIGTAERPISFLTQRNSRKWYLETEGGRIDLDWAYLEEGKIYAKSAIVTVKNSKFYDDALADEDTSAVLNESTVVRCDDSKLYFDNNYVRSDGLTQGILLFGYRGVIKNSKFFYTGDGVEFVKCSGEISGNLIENSSDDAIDLNHCDSVFVLKNEALLAKDKGISAESDGSRKTIFVYRNLIANCSVGAEIKDNLLAEIINDTFYGNGVGVKCREKHSGKGGGRAVVKNDIVANSKEPISIDAKSSITVGYSLCDSKLFEGEGNIKADPRLVYPENYNFILTPNSPCVDGGDPDSPLDEDGTRADIGALPYLRSFSPEANVVINEINYHSAPEFDSGDWAELYNPADSAVDLTGWKFMDEDDSHCYFIPNGTVLAPRGYLVLISDSSLFFSIFPNVRNYSGEFDFKLSGSGELIRLYDSRNVLADSVRYDDKAPWPTEADGRGSSLELISPDLDNALPQSWRASRNLGTPGKDNDEDSSVMSSELKFSLYPNPARDYIVVLLGEKAKSELSVDVRDVAGNLVLSSRAKEGQKSILLDLSSLSSGAYFVRIVGIKNAAAFFVKIR